MTQKYHNSSTEPVGSGVVVETLLTIKRLALSWHPNWWCVGTVCLGVCSLALLMDFLMLQNTYDLAKDVMWRQQTVIIDTQNAIIKQQSQMIEQLTGGTPPVPAQSKPQPVY